MQPPLILLVDDNRELIDLLAQIFEEAGYRARTFYRGKPAMEFIAKEPPDLAVVDLLLPDLVGHEIGKELASRRIPYILVTGVFKGAKHSSEGKSRGAKGYFEKPFEASRLLEAVQEIVPSPPKVGAREAGFEVELDIDIDEKDYTPNRFPLMMTGRIAVNGPSVQAVLTGDDFALKEATTGQKIVRPPPSLIPALEKPVQPREEVSSDGKSRRGVLQDNLPQLITAFWQLQETGELGLQRGKVKKVIYFEKGKPAFALSNLAADRFGTFLTRVGKITEAQLRIATDAAMSQKRRTGDILIEMGLLQDAERMYYVAQQVKSILYSVFAWQEGHYVMTFHAKARREPIRLGIHPAQLIARGVKKLYTLQRLHRLLALEDQLIAAEDPPYLPTDAGLEAWEIELVPMAHKARNVAELIAQTGKSSDEVFPTLVTLLSLKLLEKK